MGRKVIIRAYIDRNHAENLLNSGIIIYIKNVPIVWYSESQNKVDSLLFVRKVVALRISVEMIENIKYKLCCFGEEIEEPEEVLCSTKYVVTNSSVP